MKPAYGLIAHAPGAALALAVLGALPTGSAAQPQVPAAAAVERVTGSIVQIGLLRAARGVELRPEGRATAVDQATGFSMDLDSRAAVEARALAGGRLSLGAHVFRGQARISPAQAGGSILLDGKRYRGSLLMRPNQDETLTVVSELGIEEYLYGVLPGEMSPSWPAEALKAQAVVARTFTLANLGKYQDSGFDLSSDVLSQAYVDLDREAPAATEAVRSTDREVLWWGEELLPAHFHSCCGGATLSPAEVWGGPAPRPLRGVKDRWCAASPHSAWSAYFSDAAILAALQRHGVMAARLRSVRIGRRGASGHVRSLRISTDAGPRDVRAEDLRSWLGGSDFKSSRLARVARKSKGYVFVGRGYGHGVGLCQWGAKAMAEAGKEYREILRAYFPGAELHAWTE